MKIAVDPKNPMFCSDADGVVFSKDKTVLVCYPRGRRGKYAVPVGVTKIEGRAFEGSPWLTDVAIPDSVTTIGEWSFSNCHNLKQVTIPSGVRFIDYCTFYDCRSLESVYFKGDAPGIHSEWWYTFGGGTPTIYYRPGTKGWGRELAGKPTAVWIPEAEGKATHLVSEAFVVSEAEKGGDWEAALTEYETTYDSRGADESMRSTLRRKFAELRPKVQPNRDPEKAGVWKVRAYVFRELDFQWTDQEKKPRHSQWKMTAAEIEAIRTALDGFAEHVWANTDGSLRIDWTLEVIEVPLTKLDGDGAFWPGPGACMPYLTELKPGEADTIMVYAKVRGGQDEAGDVVPMALLGGAHGVLDGTKGATYVGFNTGGGMIAHEPPGEAELHEWLHNVQWTLEEHQGYPHGLMHSPDGGRTEGELGGDYCYRRKPGEKGWMGYYRHLMQEHVTRKMWRDLSVRSKPDNVWIRQYAHEAALLGPFPAEGKPDSGMKEPFIDEAGVVPKIGEKMGALEWRTAVFADGRRWWDGDWRGMEVNYLAIWVEADTEQQAKIRVGADDHCRVLLNGKVVLPDVCLGSLVLDQQIASVTLAKGRNLFLVKVANNGGPTGAAFRLTAPDGGLLEGVRYVK